MKERFKRKVRSLEVRNYFSTFFHNQSTGGVILLICTVLALIFANVPSLNFINEIWHKNAGIYIGNFSLEMSIGHWINDGLMAIFFFVVGLEIKREVLVGELSSMKYAALPIFAAVGGMLVPALIYAAFNKGTATASGWGIPMATDIAFVLGVLSMLGKRVPTSLKVFLTALAIVDDLGAILVIAIFYPTHTFSGGFLLIALLVVAFLILMNRLKVHSVLLYAVSGVIMWYLFYMSGIHATIAGVLLAALVPSSTRINEVRFHVRMKHLIEKFKNTTHGRLNVLADAEQQEIIHKMDRKITKINPLMHRFEYRLHPWVTFLIMPVFALSNAGVEITAGLLAKPVAPIVPGIFFGLLLGKPIGVFLFSWLSVKLKIALLPAGSKWTQILALGVLAGIGFTMSLFIDNLAFQDEALINLGKISILFTSFIAAIIGVVLIYYTTKENAPEKPNWTKKASDFIN